MISDDQNLLDLHVSHYYLHVTQPQRISELSEENRNSQSLSFHPSSKLKRLCEDSLDIIDEDIEIQNIQSIVEEQQNSIHSLNLLNNMHPQVRQFIKDNFGFRGLQFIPVELFTNYLIKQFETMFNYSEIEGIRVKLLDYLKIRMGGSLIDIQKLSNVSKTNGLIGFVSTFMTNIQFQSTHLEKSIVPDLSIENRAPLKPESQAQNIQTVIKNFAEKLFHSLEQQIQNKLHQQMTRISEKYNVALTMLYKIEKKTNIFENKKYKKEIESLNMKIKELQNSIKKTESELAISQQSNKKLTEENSKIQQKLDKVNEYVKTLQSSRYPSIPHAIPSPSNQNTSFDKSKLDQIFICSTPKSQKSRLVLIPQIATRGRSQSSSNLLLNINPTCVSARENPQENLHRRLKTEQQISKNEYYRQQRNDSLKKNSQIIHPKIRPTKMTKKNNTWKV